MKKRNLLITWFLILNLFMWTSSLVWAIPLSLDQNIKAVLANQAESGEGFDFVVIGDSRDGAEVYKRLLNRAKAYNPLFILHTGDITRRGQPFEYENYIQQIASCAIPILHLPGNHDVFWGPKTFRRYVGESNWYFDLGVFRIIGLDNATGRFSAEAVAFARKTLTSQKICLVAFHTPPPIGRWAAHGMIKDLKRGRWGEVMDLIKEAKVPMVFHGHIHLYDEIDINGTKYVISAGGGAPLYGSYNFGKPEYGFVVVQVGPNGIRQQWVPLD
ncbi:MAG: metallophosphoesterase [Syntrophales bacterium LBB04]|nr:metallophosphoesterase [Syntrophales bacterium LBB04]